MKQRISVRAQENQSCFSLLKTLGILLVFTLISNLIFGQTANRVLENGLKVDHQEKLFLRYDNKVLKFSLSKSLNDGTNPIAFLPLSDSTIFLIQKNGINVYLQPLNPLNFSYGKELTYIVDRINLEATKAMTGVINVLNTTKTTSTVLVKSTNSAKSNGFSRDRKTTKVVTKEITVWDTCANFKAIENNLKALQKSLKEDKKEEITLLFTELKNLSFYDQQNTLQEIERIDKSLVPLKKHFDEILKCITTLTSDIEKYGCSKTSAFITKGLFNLILKDLKATAFEQQKRLDNLSKAFKMVTDIADLAKIGGGVDGLRWCIKLEDVVLSSDKISLLKLIVKENGIKLSNKNEFENVEPKEISKTEITLRKFQLFVPEISVGTAFTFFKYKTYGTTTDANGQQYIAEPKENSLKNINITTMVNWNLFIQKSEIHPLIQIGAGINEGLPTFLAGAGLRFGSASKNKIRLTGGIAMTWTKELNKLKVGDKITGTADIENDLVYQFSWPPKPYIGLQYNF